MDQQQLQIVDSGKENRAFTGILTTFAIPDHWPFGQLAVA